MGIVGYISMLVIGGAVVGVVVYGLFRGKRNKNVPFGGGGDSYG